MTIPYEQCKDFIKEADILLFRATKFPRVGWWISKYTNSPYSHAALAHLDDKEVFCIEFREFHGARSYPLRKYIEEGDQIDVFRVCKYICYPKLRLENDNFCTINLETKMFTKQDAQNVTNTALKFVNRQDEKKYRYSYWTIWQLLKTYIPIVRFRTNVNKNGNANTQKFVCSTLVNYAYRINFMDPIPFLSDEYTTPGDLARSSLFFRLFSIKNLT